MLEITVAKPVIDVLLAYQWDGVEDGWMLLGKTDPGGVLITDVIDSGPRAERGSRHVSFDKDHLLCEFEAKVQSDPRLFVIGTAHSHPPLARTPSWGDLVGVSDWVPKLRLKFGVFCIVSDVLSWFTMRPGEVGWDRVEVITNA